MSISTCGRWPTGHGVIPVVVGIVVVVLLALLLLGERTVTPMHGPIIEPIY